MKKYSALLFMVLSLHAAHSLFFFFGLGTERLLTYTCPGAPDRSYAQRSPACSKLDINTTAKLQNLPLPIIPEARASEEYAVSSWHFSVEKAECWLIEARGLYDLGMNFRGLIIE